MYKESGIVVLYPESCGKLPSGQGKANLSGGYGNISSALHEMGMTDEECREVLSSLSDLTESDEQYNTNYESLAYNKVSLSSNHQSMSVASFLTPEEEAKRKEEKRRENIEHFSKYRTSHTYVSSTSFSVGNHDYVLYQYLGAKHSGSGSDLSNYSCKYKYSVAVIQEL